MPTVSLENKLIFDLQEWTPIVPQSATSPPTVPFTTCLHTQQLFCSTICSMPPTHAQCTL